MKYYLILLLAALQSFAQTVDMEKDTIQMNEIVVQKKGKKLKLKTRSLRGPCYSPENFKEVTEVVTLVENVPKGYLETVSFYFNGQPRSGKASDPSQQTQLEVVLYEAADNNIPGARIATDPLVITVNSKTGRIRTDISGSAIKSTGKLFVGLREVERNTENNYFIDCLCNGHDKYITMARAEEDAEWARRWVCAAMKADVSVVAE